MSGVNFSYLNFIICIVRITVSQGPFVIFSFFSLSPCSMVFCFRRSGNNYLYLTSEMVKTQIKKDTLRILFTSQMEVTEQFWSYGFMAYIAETGGFVGLFLGWSLLQMKEVIILCLNHRYLKY